MTRSRRPSTASPRRSPRRTSEPPPSSSQTGAASSPSASGVATGIRYHIGTSRHARDPPPSRHTRPRSPNGANHMAPPHDSGALSANAPKHHGGLPRRCGLRRPRTALQKGNRYEVEFLTRAGAISFIDAFSAKPFSYKLLDTHGPMRLRIGWPTTIEQQTGGRLLSPPPWTRAPLQGTSGLGTPEVRDLPRSSLWRSKRGCWRSSSAWATPATLATRKSCASRRASSSSNTPRR